MAFSIPNEADAFNADQAEVDKVDFDIIVAGMGGNGVVSGCAVTAQGSPDMTVAVAAGTVRAGNTYSNVTAANVNIGAADATNPRFDLITVNNAGTLACTAGTAAAAPVFPAIPASSIVLASVYVPATDTTIATNQITDKRVVLSYLPPIVKASPETVNNSAVLQDDNELFFPVAANAAFYFRLVARYTSNTTPDFKVNFTAPAGATKSFYFVGINTAGAFGYQVNSDLAWLGNTTEVIEAMEGWVINGATAGLMTVQWAQNTQNGSDTILLANTCLLIQKVA